MKHFIRINRIEKLRCNNILLLLNKELINLIDNSINLGDVCSAPKSICWKLSRLSLGCDQSGKSNSFVNSVHFRDRSVAIKCRSRLHYLHSTLLAATTAFRKYLFVRLLVTLPRLNTSERKGIKYLPILFNLDQIF